MPKTNKEEIQELKKEVNKIKKGRDSEPKSTVYTQSSQTIDDAGLVQDLFTNLARGTGHNAFIGDDIRVSSVFIRGFIRWDSTDADVGIRLMLVRQTYEVSTAPVVMAAAAAPENILNYNATSGQRPLQPMNWHSRKNFKILKEMLVYGNDTTLQTLPFKWRVRLNHKANFDNSANPELGGLWLCAISDEPSGGNPPSISYTSRINFTDK